ncbi:MAG: DoxX family protein [Bacteroidota bacterium]
MNKQIENIASWFLAVLMLIFGLNKFLGFIPVEPPADPTAQAFMGAMFTTYLFVVVALAEIIGGLLLLVPRFRFVAWLLLLPVVFNIVAFHVAHDFIGNGIWLVPTAVFVVLGYFQLDRIVGLFGVRDRPSIAKV